MRYLNILLILVIIGVSAAQLAPVWDTGISSHHTSTEADITCHCEFHEHMDSTKIYILSCDWSDKLSAKQIGDLRSIPVKDPIANPAAISYILQAPAGLQPNNVIISPELPPPRHIS